MHVPEKRKRAPLSHCVPCKKDAISGKEELNTHIYILISILDFYTYIIDFYTFVAFTCA